MKCQQCQKNQAEIHLVEVKDGTKRSIWLCPECADLQKIRAQGLLPPLGGPARGDEAGGNDDETELPPGLGEGDSDSLASFLGQHFAVVPDDPGQQRPVCHSCGYTIDLFRQTNRLGCANCYAAFRSHLLPLLERFHRHPSHLGKAPRQEGDQASHLVEITRTRVALEKAIAAEDFEAAAVLRDRLRSLDQGRDPLGGDSQ